LTLSFLHSYLFGVYDDDDEDDDDDEITYRGGQ